MDKKLGKRKLIELTSEYIEVPKNEREIEYRYYYGTSELKFYHSYDTPHLKNVEYLIVVKYTIFLGEPVLDIEAEAVGYNNDKWRKFIKL